MSPSPPTSQHLIVSEESPQPLTKGKATNVKSNRGRQAGEGLVLEFCHAFGVLGGRKGLHLFYG
jgi:hypothetical protein